ncbi:OSJNBa0043A12.15-like protein [Zea mays]|uniref:OSJNBa0043A12.15-like protein n=1 Tax=Zea mays TaxID=4577 RepID=K7UN21_MAIZE|nr:OSJNBa0043A12.15-like protein [Zea mays]AQK47086.1 OSJNBa0043A12.15-like protein [Zea mays]|eukprot:NP_001339186.1 OSJNBa0043A12.15-like protein [Zea mays]
MASSLARLGAALPRARPRAATRTLPPPRWDAAALGASRRAAPNVCRCLVHSDVKVAPTSDFKDSSKSETWRIKMLYDGDCPLCMREVNMLRERNKSYGAIKFVDISSKDYSPDDNQGLDYETSMGRIHAVLSDGTVVTDVEAFRKLYEEVGLGWVYAVTKYEPVASMANAVYGLWAKYRMQITGRPPLEEIMASRRAAGECKDDKVCKM